jgi:hypothetical protein
VEAFGRELYAFPEPEALASAGAEALRTLGCGYRAEYLAGTALMVLEGFPLEELADMPYEDAREKLMEVPGVGADFDPNSHEAIDRSGDDATCVLEVYRKGYKLAGRVLRPAMVKVGPAPVVDAQQQ